MASFEKIINETVGKKSPSKIYKVPRSSGTLKIEKKDIVSFESLFIKKPNAGVGNGEVALFWLFGDRAGHEGGGKADLVLDKQNCEVKSYPRHDTMTLGKFKSSYTALELITFLFSFNNLFMKFGTSKTGSTNYKSLLTFGIDDLVKSLEYYNILKMVFASKNIQAELIKLGKGSASAVKAFKDINKSCNQFTKQLQKLKIFNKSKTEKDRQTCAAGIIEYLLKVKLGEKPGKNGYMVNCLKGKPTDIHFHKVNMNKLDTKYETLKQGFSVSSGEIQIKSATAIFK